MTPPAHRLRILVCLLVSWVRVIRRQDNLRSSAVDETVAVLVGPVAGLLGVGLGYAGTRRVNKAEREAAARAELERVIATYLAAIYAMVAELRSMPNVPPSRLGDAVDRFSGEGAAYVRS